MMVHAKPWHVVLWLVLLIFTAAVAAPAASAARRGSGYREFLVGKQCGACGKGVSMSSRRGQSCPHCGAYWGGIGKKYVRGRSAGRGHRQRAGRRLSQSRSSTVARARQRRARSTRARQVRSGVRFNAWQQGVLTQAAAVNPRVRELMGGVPPQEPDARVRIREVALSDTSEAGQETDPLRAADALLRTSRNAPVRIRHLALWIARHPGSSRAAIPIVYGSGAVLDELLRPVRDLFVQAALNPERYSALRRP
jgi:hypothetical protein